MSSEAQSPKLEQCERIVQNHAIGAAAVGLVPVPLLDLAGLVVVQLDMLRAMSEIYEVPFSDKLGRSLIASLVGGMVPLSSVSLLKAIPVLGPLLVGVGAPVLAGASTYAVGRVFLLHFESGGTFLTLDPEQVREHYAREFERGEALIREQTLRNIKP